MKIYTLEEIEDLYIGPIGSETRNKYEKELKEEMTLKKGMKVILYNRGTWEQGTIQRKWRRKEVLFFNIQTERGSILENVTTNEESVCYVSENKSLKLNQKINPNANTEL